jgi:hypothetical protein
VITSSGDLDILSGEVEKQALALSGSGDFHGGDWRSAKAEVRLSCSGSATIQVQEYLKAGPSTSGDPRYAGRPKVESTTTSSGDVGRTGD